MDYIAALDLFGYVILCYVAAVALLVGSMVVRRLRG
jgi:hypothetical protein